MMSVMESGNPNNMSPEEQEKMALKLVNKTERANKEIENSTQYVIFNFIETQKLCVLRFFIRAGFEFLKLYFSSSGF